MEGHHWVEQSPVKKIPVDLNGSRTAFSARSGTKITGDDKASPYYTSSCFHRLDCQGARCNLQRPRTRQCHWDSTVSLNH